MSKRRKLKADGLYLPQEQKSDKLIMILIFLTIGLVPLIVHYKIELFVSPAIDPMIVFNTGKTYYMFTYYKFILLAIICFLLLVTYCYQLLIIKKQISDSKINIFLAIYTIFLLLSTVLSDYKTIALFGIQGRNMGLIAFLCFGLLMFVTMNSPELLKYVKYIYYVLSPLVCINAILVVLKYLDYHVLSNKLVSWLIAGGRELSKGSFIMGTLAHFNYISGLGAILFAFFATAFIFQGRKRKDAILCFMMAILSSIIVFGSKSLSGVVTYIFIVILLSAITVSYKDKNRLVRLGGVILSTGIVYVLMALYNNSFSKELLNDSAILGASVISALIFIAVLVMFHYLRQQPGRKRLIFGCITIAFFLLFGIIAGPKVEYKVDEELRRINSDAILQELDKDEFNLPEYGWAWGTGRIYLWQETLELSLHKPLFGYGLDTLPFAFNQGDPAKIAAVNDAMVTVDKPHNVYVNMLYGSGVVALLSYLAIIGIVLFRSFKTIIERKENALRLLPFVIGILAYLYQGLFNDPVQGVEPILWVFLGFGYLLTNNYGPEREAARAAKSPAKLLD